MPESPALEIIEQHLAMNRKERRALGVLTPRAVIQAARDQLGDSLRDTSALGDDE